MPIDYHFDESRRLVVSRARGVLTAEELSDNRAQRLRDPAIPPGTSYLLDLREVTRIDTEAERVRELAEQWSTSEAAREGGLVAVVAGSDETFGMARMYEMSRRESPRQVRVFRDVAEAEKWLGLVPSDASSRRR